MTETKQRMVRLQKSDEEKTAWLMAEQGVTFNGLIVGLIRAEYKREARRKPVEQPTHAEQRAAEQLARLEKLERKVAKIGKNL